MCHIGLNPQNEGEYMNTAFPSKILSYLSHGLVVVSTRVRSIQESKISKLINFTEDDNPKSIANTIKAINIDKQPDNVHLIKKLDMDFTKALGDLLKK
jgi:penicillin-binding protein-related factor A (putative recombinase)